MEEREGVFSGGGRTVLWTEPIPNLVVGDFGPGGSKPKSGKGKRKPNSEPGPNRVTSAREIDMSAILYPPPRIVNKIKTIEYSGGTGLTRCSFSQTTPMSWGCGQRG